MCRWQTERWEAEAIIDTPKLPQMLRRLKALRTPGKVKLTTVLHYATETPYRAAYPVRASLSYSTVGSTGGANDLLASQILTWVGFRREINEALLVMPDAVRIINGKTVETCDAKVPLAAALEARRTGPV
jgi:hypothetical protein